jgi:hypothetical protein
MIQKLVMNLLLQLILLLGFAISIVLDIVTLLLVVSLVPTVIIIGYFVKKWDIGFRRSNNIVTFGPKTNNIILFLHGSGFNWSEFLFGLLIFRNMSSTRNKYQLITLNIDGLLSNQPHLGYDDYALQVYYKLLEYNNTQHESSELINDNNIRQLHIIGHSLGGLIGNELRNIIIKGNNNMTGDNKHTKTIIVKSLITICTPYRGAPLLDNNICCKPSQKRYVQMSKPIHFQNVNNIVGDITVATRQLHIGSHHDICVPFNCAFPLSLLSIDNKKSPDLLTSSPTITNCKYYLFGHYSIMLNPIMWFHIVYFVTEP